MDIAKLKNNAKNFLSGGRYPRALFYTLFVTLISSNYLTSVVDSDTGVSSYYVGLSILTPMKEIGYITFQRLGLLFIFLSLFISPMFRVSLAKFYMRDYSDMARFNDQKFLSVGSENYGNIIRIFMVRGLKIFLWTLLFIVPGIIKAYEYFMLPYILAEDPALSRREAFEISRLMMEGNKMNVFILGLSFIGWRLAGLLIPGAIFLINPYIEASFTQAYLEIKEEKGLGLV